MENKYFCRNCKGIRNHQELHKVEKRGGDDEDYFQWISKFIIIECLGCETISFLKIYGDTDMLTHDEYGYQDYYFENTIYPSYLDQVSELNYQSYIPESIRIIYKETINAYKANAYILTAGGLRAIIEAICNHLKIKKGNLAERIDILHNKGHLTQSESKRLHTIRFLGNDALHEIEKPNKKHLVILFEIVNHLLANLFINDKKLKGKIDTIIDNYEEFYRLIRNKINKESVGKELTLGQLFGKSKRLIPKKNYQGLVEEFVNEVKKGHVEFVTIISEEKETIFKIEKESKLSFLNNTAPNKQ